MNSRPMQQLHSIEVVKKSKMQRESFLKIKFAAIIFLGLCACKGSSDSIKRMEGFDIELFHKRFYNKEPVVITKTKENMKVAATEIFQKCSKQLVYLTRLPSMQEDLNDISLTEAFRSCGADCYGLYETKVCDEAIDIGVELPEGFHSDDGLWYSIAHEAIETPAMVTAGHYFRFISAGVEDWRLLTRFDDGIIDLFTQHQYADKLISGDLLYVPPNTLTQHSALTPLSVAIGSS